MTATLIRLGLGAVCSVALPVAPLLWLRRKRRVRLAPFFVGVLIFIVFALLLEPLAHWVFLRSDNAVSRAINANVYLYMLYGGLAAGLFEETGRCVAFRFLLLRRRFPERDTALAYGIGHGGAEAVLMLGGSYAAYAALTLFTARGDEATALALCGGNAEALAAMRAGLETLTTGAVLLALSERGAAMLLHIALSCFVFRAARDRTQRRWFWYAVVLHAVADMPVALYQRGALPLSVVELWAWLVALCALYTARKCYLEAMAPYARLRSHGTQ